MKNKHFVDVLCIGVLKENNLKHYIKNQFVFEFEIFLGF